MSVGDRLRALELEWPEEPDVAPRVRYAFTKASCTTSSASAAEPVMTYAVRKAIPWCSRTSWS